MLVVDRQPPTLAPLHLSKALLKCPPDLAADGASTRHSRGSTTETTHVFWGPSLGSQTAMSAISYGLHRSALSRVVGATPGPRVKRCGRQGASWRLANTVSPLPPPQGFMALLQTKGVPPTQGPLEVASSCVICSKPKVSSRNFGPHVDEAPSIWFLQHSCS